MPRLMLFGGLAGRPDSLEIEECTRVIVMPSGCGHLVGVGSEGIGALLCFEGKRTVSARFAAAGVVDKGVEVLVSAGRFGWQRGVIA